MKILILSNTAGQGHHSTANALIEMAESMGAECRMLDSYAYISPVLYETIAHGYLLATSVTPSAYGRFYRIAENKEKNDSRFTLQNAANSIMSLKLKKYFKEEFKPDIIVCTHIFSAQLINAMKANGLINTTAFGIITDYTIHPFWQDVTYLDYFVTASELLTKQAEKKGVNVSKLLPFGIPVHSKFSKKMPKDQARKLLGIDPDKFTLLLMSGSMGYGNIAKVLKRIDSLDNDFQVLAVCGYNKHAKHKIDSLSLKKQVYSYGFVNNVDIMMDAADCIVTKPGGLTSSEALAKCLPIVMINPIPGQEERNVEFMLNNGLAVNATKTFPIDEALYQLFLYPQKLKLMEESIKIIGKPFATRDLCKFMINLKR